MLDTIRVERIDRHEDTTNETELFSSLYQSLSLCKYALSQILFLAHSLLPLFPSRTLSLCVSSSLARDLTPALSLSLSLSLSSFLFVHLVRVVMVPVTVQHPVTTRTPALKQCAVVTLCWSVSSRRFIIPRGLVSLGCAPSDPGSILVGNTTAAGSVFHSVAQRSFFFQHARLISG